MGVDVVFGGGRESSHGVAETQRRGRKGGTAKDVRGLISD